jgi:ribosomal protein S18 acetylase RimI-like enzyme
VTAYALVPATNADKPWLDRLRRDAYRDLFFATWGGWDEERHARHFAASWDQGNIRIIHVGAAPVGMVQTVASDDSIEIGEIQIVPAHQGRGLATAVIGDIIANARAADKDVTLSTGLKNTGAIALYQRLGFTETHRSEAKVYMAYTPPGLSGGPK